MHRTWMNDYGMAAVLLALCVLFSALTWGEQRPTGQAAAWQLAAEIPAGRKVVIVRPATNEGEVFAETLTTELTANDGTIVATLAGEPFEVREQLDALLKTSEKFDTLAVHPTTYPWTIYEGLAETHAALKDVSILSPAPLRGSSFLTPTNLLNVANQIAVIAIIAIGMTMIIITGGIDLSVGSLVALSAVTITWLIREHGGGQAASTSSVVLAGAGALALCSAIGALSGTMVTRFRLPAFIVTLAVMLIARGLAERISQNQSIDVVPASFTWLGIGTVVPGLPNAVVLTLVLYAIAHVVMTRTVFGRYVYALGGNAKAAWLSGVPVHRMLIGVYTAGGALAGLAGIVLASQLKSGAATYGVEYELYVIAAVVVGGTSLKGGEGRIFSTLVGALIIAVIQNGMNLLGLQQDLQRMVLGGMILGAVLLDSLQRNRRG
jgi:ribose transport system permease protein